MLKHIPDIISPDLMRVLMDMGHGDELILGDANFPAAEVARRLVYAKGNDIPELLEAILKFFPLDEHSEKPVGLMQPGPQFDGLPKVWDEYRAVLGRSDENNRFTDFEYIDRFKFYERAQNAFAVVNTSETALFANVILKKGFI